MSDLEIVELVIFAGIVFYCGMKFAEWRLIKAMLDLLSPEEREELRKSVAKIEEDDAQDRPGKIESFTFWEKDVININHEVVGEIHIFYRDDGTFLCQGISLEDAAKKFAEASKTPKLGLVTTSTGKKMAVINGVLQEVSVS